MGVVDRIRYKLTEKTRLKEEIRHLKQQLSEKQGHIDRTNRYWKRRLKKT